jgi:hypothetical protein
LGLLQTLVIAEALDIGIAVWWCVEETRKFTSSIRRGAGRGGGKSMVEAFWRRRIFEDERGMIQAGGKGDLKAWYVEVSQHVMLGVPNPGNEGASKYPVTSLTQLAQVCKWLSLECAY